MSAPALPASVVLAAGGTAGHVEPALALADALCAARPGCRVTVLGTATGLEARLVPARGYELATMARVPLPRRPGPDLLALPGRLAGAVRTAHRVLRRVEAEALVGFGGYAALPGYLAARRLGLPFVVHEANPRPGLANRVGARLTPFVAVSVEGTRLAHAELTGLPLRPGIAQLDRAAARGAARAALGLTDGPVLLVFGGSQGARRLNAALSGAAAALCAAGVQVLHLTGAAQLDEVRRGLPGGPPAGYHLLGYLDDMAPAYAAADLALCRAGAMTCAELSAVGLPAIYVPLPIGNGEQRLNAEPVVRRGGGLLLADAELSADRLAAEALPLLADPARLAAMAAAARRTAGRDPAAALLDLLGRACGTMRR